MPPIQFAINSYQSRALPLSAQQVVNLFAEAAPRDAKSPVVLLNAPGIKSFADRVGTGPIRGMEVMDGLLYAVSGCELYRVESTGRAIALGNICIPQPLEPGPLNQAEGEFEIVAGSAGSGNTVSSITINGEEALNEPVDFTTDTAVTAGLVATAINEGPLGTSRDVECGWDLSTQAFGASASLEVALHEAMALSKDGTKLYIGYATDDIIRQYTLSTAFDITTKSSTPTKTFDVSTITHANVQLVGMTLADDDKRLFFFDSWNVIVYGCVMSTAGDVSTLSLDSQVSIASFINPCRDVFMKPDGTRLFCLEHFEAGGPEVGQMDLSTAWDLDTAVAGGTFTLTQGGIGNRFTGLFFQSGDCLDPSAHKMYVIAQGFGAATVSVYEYDLGTAWDITTTVYNSITANLDSDDNEGRSVWLGDDGARMYTSGRENNSVYQYSLDTVTTTIEGKKLYEAVADGDTIIITVLGTNTQLDPESFNGLPVNIVPTGDVQVDAPATTLEGAFQMSSGTATGAGGPHGCECISISHNAADPPQLVIADGGSGWIYDTVNGLRQITDADFLPPMIVDFQDQYFVFNHVNTGQFFLSNLNDGTAYLATDIATAEGDPDNLVALISNRRELWLFGAETIEIWYNSGNADFPFARFEGGFIERGCAAPFSIAEDDNSIFWLGEDRIFYRADGYVPVRISQHAIEEALRKYKNLFCACAFIYTMEGHKFYVITFPAEDATWCYDLTTGLWHERRSVGMGRWRVSAYAEAYGKHLVGDFEKGRIGELDLDTYQEWGETMQGLAAGPPAHADRTRVSHRRFELDIESGVGLTSGQGSDPQIWLDWSDDGGRTFSARKPFRSMGKIGEYQQRLRWNRMGSARERIYRVTVSDPIKRSIIAAHLNARQGRA